MEIGIGVGEGIAQLIHEYGQFAITTHISPEADAIGSALALRLILHRLEKRAAVVLQDPLPSNLRFLKGSEGVRRPGEPLGFEPEAWLVVDCASLERVGESVRQLIEKGSQPIVNIDHHLGNTNFGRLNWVQPVAATALLILELAHLLKVEPDPQIATCLYAGIVADTDSFRNANTTREVFEAASYLVERGARAREVAQNLYERRSLGELRLLGYALLNAQIEELEDRDKNWRRRIIWCALPREAFSQVGAAPHETERLVEELRTLEGVEVAVLFRELEGGRVKVSLRSKGELNVSELAQRFGGGGHEQAAGCVVKGELSQVEGLILEELRRRLSGDAGQPR